MAVGSPPPYIASASGGYFAPPPAPSLHRAADQKAFLLKDKAEIINLRLHYNRAEPMVPVEHAVLTSAVWIQESDKTWTLGMPNSGSSGFIRFCFGNGDIVIVIIGVHNWANWGDCFVDVPSSHDSSETFNMYGGEKNGIRWRATETDRPDPADINCFDSKGRRFTMHFQGKGRNRACELWIA